MFFLCNISFNVLFLKSKGIVLPIMRYPEERELPTQVILIFFILNFSNKLARALFNDICFISVLFI